MAIFYHRTVFLLNKIPQDVVLSEKVELKNFKTLKTQTNRIAVNKIQ